MFLLERVIKNAENLSENWERIEAKEKEFYVALNKNWKEIFGYCK